MASSPGVPAASSPGVPLASSPGVPLASSPGVPLASSPGVPLASSPGVPLEGLRIIELSSYIASPLGGMTLAQLGADVIRIDPIGGASDRRRWPLAPSGASLYWAGLNKGKRSVTVDLKSAEGRQLVADLVASSGPRGGIVLTNAVGSGCLAWPALRARRPDLIGVQLTGRADGGTAVDYTVNASVGFAGVTGPPDLTGPVNHVVPVWDVACGLYLAVGLLAAERHRLLTGEGQQVNLALHDVALATAGNLGLLAEAQLGSQRPRIGNDIYGGLGRDFAVAGGGYVMVVVLTARHWSDLLAATGLQQVAASLERALEADFGTEADRYEHREALFGLLARWFRARTVEEISRALRPTSVMWSPYRDFAQAASDGAAGTLLAPLRQPGIGEHLAPGSPLTLAGHRMAPQPAPALGEHADAVLGELLGTTSAETARLRAAGIIGP